MGNKLKLLESFRIDKLFFCHFDKIAVFHTPAWTYNEERGQCYLHQFTPEQPDLNYRNKEVYDEMIETLKYWLEKGADGFRIDAINHMFEVEGLPDEFYVDEDGDRNSYDNLIHNHTMNLVSDIRMKGRSKILTNLISG